MKYRFTINDSTEPPTRPEIEFRARTPERAYQFVIRHIVNDDRNRALKMGTLSKLDAFGWETMMVWKRGPGWVFPDGRSNVLDNRKAPGA